MLLRFSHHQIFLFIVELLQMFELNQALVFPAAPLLTVILALVGGSRSLCQNSCRDGSDHVRGVQRHVHGLLRDSDRVDRGSIRRDLLSFAHFQTSLVKVGIWRLHKRVHSFHCRFFYVYHFAFYAYQYRFNGEMRFPLTIFPILAGQYGGLALLTSTCFILVSVPIVLLPISLVQHSMVFFFHHYEMPLILYQERLQRIINDLQHNSVSLPLRVHLICPALQTEHGETGHRARDLLLGERASPVVAAPVHPPPVDSARIVATVTDDDRVERPSEHASK